MNESIDASDSRESGRRWDGGQELRCHIPLWREDAKRSARNIQQWNAYLPAACVRVMVQMGWDYTT